MTYLARALLPLLAAAGALAANAEPIEVTTAWVRATPPGARTGAAYLTLTNHGPADRLVGATSPAAHELQLHTQIADGQVQRMVALAQIELPAGATVRLEPGGMHVMLLDLLAPLAPGTSVQMTLRFAAAAPLTVDVPIIDARTTAAPTHAPGP